MTRRETKAKKKGRSANADNSNIREALRTEKSIAQRYHLPGLKLPVRCRSVTEKMIEAALFPAHTGRKEVYDTIEIWDVSFGKCNKRFLDGELSTCPIDPLSFIGPDRLPIFFPDLRATREGFGMRYPEDLNVRMVIDSVGPNYPGNVVNNFSGERMKWPVKLWGDYLEGGKPLTEHVPPPPLTAQHNIFNMTGLEITGTKLAEKIHLPFLQEQLDPLKRFEEIGRNHEKKGLAASLYAMSASPGSFTPWHVDASGEVHWLTVVDGEKWVFLLPPTADNIAQYRLGEAEKVRADLQWLPDNCAETPVLKVVLKAGQSLLIPSGYLHAVFTPVATLALAGAWVDEYNIESHISWRKLEFATKTLKSNRFPYFERICWLMAEEWSHRLKPKTARMPRMEQLVRLEHLLDFVTDQTDRRDKKAEGNARTATSSLPEFWRDLGRDKTVANELRQAIDKMKKKLAEKEAETEQAKRASEERRVRERKAEEDMREKMRREADRRKEAGRATKQGTRKEVETLARKGASETKNSDTHRERPSARTAEGKKKKGKEAEKARDAHPAPTRGKKVSNADGLMADYMRKEVVRGRKRGNGEGRARSESPPVRPKVRAVLNITIGVAPATETATVVAKAKAKSATKRAKPVERRTELHVAPGKEQERMEILLGKRKAVEEVAGPASKRPWERDGSVEWLGGEHNGNWED